MSNSNFTPETLPSFPLSTLLQSLQWRVEKGWKESQGMIGRGRLDVPRKYIHKMARSTVAQKAVKKKKIARESSLLTFVIKSMMYYCLPYLIPSHSVLLAERPAVFKPAQPGPGVASCSTAELDCVGSWHRMQLLLHLRRWGPIRSAYDHRTVAVQSGWDFLIMSSALTVWLQGAGLANADTHGSVTAEEPKPEPFLTLSEIATPPPHPPPPTFPTPPLPTAPTDLLST